MRIIRNVETIMRDGMILRCDLYLPDQDGRYPAILVRTPYEKNAFLAKPRYTQPQLYTEAGYAVVVQDCRGTGESDGVYKPWLMDAEDGYDTVEWIAGQDWCTGRIGMMGSSNLGATQLLTASMRPPHLCCISPAGTSAGFPFFKNGIIDLAGTSIWYMQQAVRTSKRAGMAGEELKKLEDRMNRLAESLDEQFYCLPLKDIPFANVTEVQMDLFFLEYLDHLEEIGYWSRLHMPADLKAIEVPTLWIMNWYDHLAKTVLEGYHTMKHYCVPKVQENLYLYFGPWRIYSGVSGCEEEDCLPGDSSMQPVWGNGKRLSDMLIDWFDCWLKDGESSFNREQHILVHTMGDERRWRYEDSWPLPGTSFQKYYLSSVKGANSLNGDGVLTQRRPEMLKVLPDSYDYDPKNPAPTKSGVVINPKDTLVQDQTEVEERPDVLVYTAEALSGPLEITGPVKVSLWASTDGPDTDFVVKLVDVDEKGIPRNLIEGIVRARFRNGWDKPELLEPGAVYEYEIDLGAVGIVFGKGHRIRLEVSSSNFPKWDRNLNTGKAVGLDSEVRVARQKIYHDGEHPSYVLLPVIVR